MEKGFFGSMFDFNNDGKLDAMERTFDFMAFNELMIEAEKAEREALEDAGLDPDEFEF